MEEVQFQRPVTPSQTPDAWLHDSADEDHHPSPPPPSATHSPHDSFGGNLSSLSSRNSSLSRSQSKASLRSFFSRGRSASVASQRPDTSMSRGRPAGGSATHSRQSSTTVARAESPHLSQIGSRLDSYRPTQATHAAHVERARSKHHTAQRRPSRSWDPLPLFQASAQSLKHAVLDASCLPADVILRKSAHGHGRPPPPPDAATADPMATPGVATLLKKAKDHKHARKLSASISSSGWVKHLFVLLESGHLLQYAGSGHDDRLPEKMMQLGRDTVAFASDAIPGRHWVLQVSQADHNGSALAFESSKGLWSRIGVQSAESRRTAQNFLLVFDNATDLDAWLTTIRREVEALGGRQYGPESLPDGEAAAVVSSPSLPVMAGPQDAYHFPSNHGESQHHHLSPVASEFLESDGDQADDQMHDFRFWDPETASRTASPASSTLTSTDLDRLRDSKDSGESANTGTSTSLHRPSPSSSPGCAAVAPRAVPPGASVRPAVVLASPRPPPPVPEGPGEEPHSPTFFCHALDVGDMDDAAVHTSRGAPPRRRTLSTATPNFSVPISSHRFSFLGSSDALTTDHPGGTATANAPVAPHHVVDNGHPADDADADDDDDDDFSRRPVSTIAPLPTLDALMDPAGTRTRTVRRPSMDHPLRSPPRPDHPPPTATRGHDDDDPSSRRTRTRGPDRSAVRAHPVPTLAPRSPFPRDVPALLRSSSSLGLSTFYHAGARAAPLSSAALAGRDQRHPRPLSLSGFPEPPSRLPATLFSPLNATGRRPAMPVTPVAFSSTTSLPAVVASGVPARLHSRLWRRREARGLPKLGITPPSGPPPSCPLPATPSPRKRHFRPFPSPTSPGPNYGPVLPPPRLWATGMATRPH